jgi:hypothetical protein
MRAFLLGFVLVCGCKGEPKRDPAPAEPAPAPAPVEPTPVRVVRDAGVDRAVWRTRIEHTPGETVITWVNGPNRFGDEIWVGSSAIGVAALEPDTGAQISREPKAGPFLKRPEDPEAIRTARVAGATVQVTRSAIERAGMWRYAWEDRADLGVAGPLRFGDVVAVVADEALIGLGWDDGRERWRLEERFAHDPDALRAGAGNVLRTVSLEGGVGPVIIDPESGEVVRRGHRARGEQVLAAAWTAGGALAVVVRRDRSMKDDALAMFDASGALVWEWPLPVPDEPRVDPAGLLADGDGFVLFYDGRYAARFDAP